MIIIITIIIGQPTKSYKPIINPNSENYCFCNILILFAIFIDYYNNKKINKINKKRHLNHDSSYKGEQVILLNYRLLTFE